jgi:hypothetical protein
LHIFLLALSWLFFNIQKGQVDDNTFGVFLIWFAGVSVTVVQRVSWRAFWSTSFSIFMLRQEWTCMTTISTTKIVAPSRASKWFHLCLCAVRHKFSIIYFGRQQKSKKTKVPVSIMRVLPSL